MKAWRAVAVGSAAMALALVGWSVFVEPGRVTVRTMLTHNPDVFPGVPARVALTLAAHTHGGQVRLPPFPAPVVPSRYGSRYAAGHVIEGGRHSFVTTGVGTSILPVRFAVPPEVVILVPHPGGRLGG